MAIYFNNLNDVEQNEIRIKKLEMLKNHYKQMANILSSNEVMALLEKWQGKKYNKRLETALKAIDNHFYIDKQFGIYLNYGFFDYAERSFTDNNGRTIYIDTYKHNIRLLCKNTLTEENILRDDMQEEVLKTAKYYQLEYEKLNNQLFLINDILKEFKEIATKYNEFEEKINFDIRKEFYLNLQSM